MHACPTCSPATPPWNPQHNQFKPRHAPPRVLALIDKAMVLVPSHGRQLRATQEDKARLSQQLLAERAALEAHAEEQTRQRSTAEHRAAALMVVQESLAARLGAAHQAHEAQHAQGQAMHAQLQSLHEQVRIRSAAYK